MKTSFKRGETVTLTESSIMKRDFASLGVTVDTEFTITSVMDHSTMCSAAFLLKDSFGAGGYYVTENDLIAV